MLEAQICLKSKSGLRCVKLVCSSLCCPSVQPSFCQFQTVPVKVGEAKLLLNLKQFEQLLKLVVRIISIIHISDNSTIVLSIPETVPVKLVKLMVAFKSKAV
jgi:hypothetical protein